MQNRKKREQASWCVHAMEDDSNYEADLKIVS